MNLKVFFSSLLATAFLSITSVEASPFKFMPNGVGNINLQARDLYVDSATTCEKFVLGATQTEIGTVCIGISSGIVTVNYGPLSNGCTYTDAHVWVGTSPPTDRNPGGFPYATGGKGCTFGAGNATVTCTFPVMDAWRQCEKTLYIATHGSVSCSSGGGTAWGKGTCFGGTQGNCAKYWSLTTHCYCPSVSVYPQQYSTSSTTYTSTSTTEFLTSTTITYLTSTTSEYLTSTTIEYTTSTTSEFSTTEYPEETITSTTTSTLPLSSTTYTLTCTNPYA